MTCGLCFSPSWFSWPLRAPADSKEHCIRITRRLIARADNPSSPCPSSSHPRYSAYRVHDAAPDTPAKAAKYRKEAAACLEIATRMSIKSDRKNMMEMAQQWIDLAQQAEAGNHPPAEPFPP